MCKISLTHHIFIEEYCFAAHEILNILSVIITVLLASAGALAKNALSKKIFISV